MTEPNFPITVVRFKIQHLIDWLTPQLLSDALLVAGHLPEMPHRAIGLVGQPGRGFDLENDVDQPVVNFMCRGGIADFSDAEDIAYEVDSVFMQAPSNFDIADSVHVDAIYRQGGAPSSLPITDAKNRWVFTCPYVVRTFTNLQ